MKKQILHTIIWKEKDLYVAKFVEIELASQGKTKQTALANLKEALELYLEDEDIDALHLPQIEEVTTQTISLS